MRGHFNAFCRRISRSIWKKIPVFVRGSGRSDGNAAVRRSAAAGQESGERWVSCCGRCCCGVFVSSFEVSFPLNPHFCAHVRPVGPWTGGVKIREKRTLLRDFGSRVRAGALSGGKLTLACRWKPQPAWRSPTQLGKRPALRTRHRHNVSRTICGFRRLCSGRWFHELNSRECSELDGERGTEGRGS